MSRAKRLNFLNAGARHAGHLGRVCLLGTLLPTLAACTEFKPGSDIPATEQGALLGNGSAGSQTTGTTWGCLQRPPSEAPPRATVSYTVRIVDSITNEPPPGLAVQACDDIDLTCSRPVAPPTGVSADGRVRISLAQGFDGYFEVLSETTLPTRLYPDGILRDDEDGVLLELIDEMTAVALAAGAGLTLEPDTGLVLARAFDCQGALSSGVRLENDTGGVAFAFIDGLPIEGPVTGGEGLVVFANVPVGYTFIEGTIDASGIPMGSTTVESRPGWLVYADVRPPP